VAGVFERFPRALHEVAVLRVEDRAVLRAEAEELAIEHLHPVEQAGARHVARLTDLLGVLARGDQLVLAQGPNRLHAGDKVLPVLAGVLGAGHAERDADDGDVIGVVAHS